MCCPCRAWTPSEAFVKRNRILLRKQFYSSRSEAFLDGCQQALTFDPESTELRFCEPDESPNANSLLMSYLNDFISIEANGQRIPIKLENKSLKGEGINTALQISFEYPQETPLKTLKIKNTVFTDLFFDQTNIIYVHINSDSTSLMLNKRTPSHTLTF